MVSDNKENGLRTHYKIITRLLLLGYEQVLETPTFGAEHQSRGRRASFDATACPPHLARRVCVLGDGDYGPDEVVCAQGLVQRPRAVLDRCLAQGERQLQHLWIAARQATPKSFRRAARTVRSSIDLPATNTVLDRGA